MHRTARFCAWLVVLAVGPSCGGDVISEPDGKSGGAGGAGAAGSTASGTGANGSSASSSSSSGVGGIDITSSAQSSSSGGEVHTMCFTWDDPSLPCPTVEEAPGHLCTPCPGKGCSFIGQVLGRGVFQNGSCCYEVTGDCVPNP